MRVSLDCSKLNRPRQIAGIDFKVVVGILAIFGNAAMLYKTPSVMVVPLVILWLIHGPAKRDPALVAIHMRHRQQHDYYSPTYTVGPKNLHAARPVGFNRGMMV